MRTLTAGWMQRGALSGWLLATLLTGGVASVQAEPTGEVEFARGVGVAQAPGQAPRALGKGLALNEGDRLTTSDGSTAIVKLQDGTRMTLRPNSELVVQKYQFKEGASDNSMLLQLLRGGLRAITGLISKGSSSAAKIQTATDTIGIRGTDFDARLCGPECRAESSKVIEKPRLNAVLASAKLVAAQGEISAIDGAGSKRSVVDGGSIYAGETVVTGPASKVVLAFRDESRLTLGSNTQFRVDSFVFDNKNPNEGRFLVSLLRGSLRALTGLIGKANTRNVGFTTATATIGIRGTGLDLDCAASDACSFFTWLGTIEVTPNGSSALQTLQAGEGLFVSRDGIRPLTASTLEDLARPDRVQVNMPQLFSSGGVSGEDEGLFVFVREGHIEVVTASQTLQLGRGETGYAGKDGRTGRPESMPLFLQADTVPMPNSSNPMLLNVLSELGIGSNMCR
ncbi:MAG: FecR domain-containing protein [Burkholderiales bacterium]|nr:FecR domain-containing protein [Burkholderiales bacterium]